MVPGYQSQYSNLAMGCTLWDSYAGKGRKFFLRSVQTSSGAHPASYWIYARGS